MAVVDTSMRMSQYFLPVLKETPADAQIASHRLMLRAGMVRQSASGIYSWMPLGLRVLRRIEAIIHEEQGRAGHLPLLMSTLQPASLWRESGRYDDYGEEMLRIRDRHDREMLYGPTNEEQITDIIRSHVRSYRDLPLTLYQVQWKFRDEVRPRFGVMRGREFLMKDGYSFDVDKESALHAYDRHMISYLRTYRRLGLNALPMRADTGPIGGTHSHEFLVLAGTGESEVYFDGDLLGLDPVEGTDFDSRDHCRATTERWTSLYARTSETHDPDQFAAQIPHGRQCSSRAIEVGQIFYFGTKYSEPMAAYVANADGHRVALHMGSHGIGVSRLVGAIIEASHDDKGIIWPDSVAPFPLGIVNLSSGEEATESACDRIGREVTASGLDYLLDDRSERAGAKFATMDLIGLPWRITVGARGVASGVAELTCRRSGQTHYTPLDEIVRQFLELRNAHGALS